MPILAAGSTAPAFSAATSGGGTVDSATMNGPVVLCFYPGNNTPG
jgi:peroxiredoxin